MPNCQIAPTPADRRKFLGNEGAEGTILGGLASSLAFRACTSTHFSTSKKTIVCATWLGLSSVSKPARLIEKSLKENPFLHPPLVRVLLR